MYLIRWRWGRLKIENQGEVESKRHESPLIGKIEHRISTCNSKPVFSEAYGSAVQCANANHGQSQRSKSPSMLQIFLPCR